MKRFLLFFTFSLIVHLSNAQHLHWAYSFTDPSTVQETARAIASDGTDNFVLIGGGIEDVSMDVINGGSQYASPPAFIAKYNANAELQWLGKAPTPSSSSSYLLSHMAAIDNSGNVYTCGLFSGTVDFDPGSGTQNVTAIGGDAFLQKLDADGNYIWTAHTTAGGPPTEIAFKSNGNALIAGKADGNVQIYLSNGDSVFSDKGMYLLEINGSGDVIGAYTIPMPEAGDYFYLRELEVDANDNIYLGGQFDGAADFDITENGTHWDTSASAYDAFVAKYNSNFELQWQKSFGDVPGGHPASWDDTWAIEVDGNGNVYAAGHFTYTTDFDPDDNPGTFILQADDGSQAPNGFIMEYDPNGVLQWVKDLGGHVDSNSIGNQALNIFDMELQDNNLFVTGMLDGSADFDPSAGEHWVQAQGAGPFAFETTMFFGLYDTQGNFNTVFTIDTMGVTEENIGIELLGTGSFVTAGLTSKAVDFDPLEGIHILSTDSTGSLFGFDKDIYIARYSFTGLIGVNEIGERQELLLYPNPVNDVLNISLPQGEFYDVMVYDAVGRQVIRTNSNGLTKLDVSSLESGAYFILATDGEISYTGKFIK